MTDALSMTMSSWWMPKESTILKIFALKVNNENSLAKSDFFLTEIRIFTGADGCRDTRQYAVPQIGVSEDRIAQHVDVYFYVDKELLVNSPHYLGSFPSDWSVIASWSVNTLLSESFAGEPRPVVLEPIQTIVHGNLNQQLATAAGFFFVRNRRMFDFIALLDKIWPIYCATNEFHLIYHAFSCFPTMTGQ